jgi:hypothetical protein
MFDSQNPISIQIQNFEGDNSTILKELTTNHFELKNYFVIHHELVLKL